MRKQMLGIVITLVLCVVYFAGCTTTQDPEGTIRCHQCQNNEDVDQLYVGDTCPDGWYPEVQDCSTPPSQFEDLTTYTQTGNPLNGFVISDNAVNFSDLPRSASSYLYKQMSLNQFDLTFNFTISDYDEPITTPFTAESIIVAFTNSPLRPIRNSLTNQSVLFSAYSWKSEGGTLYHCLVLQDYRRPWNENTDFCQFLTSNSGLWSAHSYKVHIYKVGSQVNIDVYDNDVWVYSDFLELSVTSASGTYTDMSFTHFMPVMGANQIYNPIEYMSGVFYNYEFIAT